MKRLFDGAGYKYLGILLEGILLRRTKKLMTMDNPFRPKSNVDRLYIPRQVGGRGFQSVKEIMNLTNL